MRATGVFEGNVNGVIYWAILKEKVLSKSELPTAASPESNDVVRDVLCL